MLIISETRNINATSTVTQKDQDGTTQDAIVANLTATVEADNKTSVNVYVYDQALFEKNKESTVNDMISFIRSAYGVEE